MSKQLERLSDLSASLTLICARISPRDGAGWPVKADPASIAEAANMAAAAFCDGQVVTGENVTHLTVPSAVLAAKPVIDGILSKIKNLTGGNPDFPREIDGLREMLVRYVSAVEGPAQGMLGAHTEWYLRDGMSVYAQRIEFAARAASQGVAAADLSRRLIDEDRASRGLPPMFSGKRAAVAEAGQAKERPADSEYYVGPKRRLQQQKKRSTS